MIHDLPSSAAFDSGTMMADNRDVPNSLTDLDNLDLDFEQSNNQNDFDNLLGQEAQDGHFALDDDDFDALLADTGGGNGGASTMGAQGQQMLMSQRMPQPVPESMPQQHQNLMDDSDPLESMPINQVSYDGGLQPKYNDPLMGDSMRDNSIRTTMSTNSTLQPSGLGQASMGNHDMQSNQFGQHNGMAGPQVTTPQVGGQQVGGGGQAGIPNDLEAQKNYLLNKLKEVQQQKEKLAQSNGMQRMGGFQQTTPFPTPQHQQNRKTPLVASVNSVSSIKPTESALSSFLRGARKTNLEAGSRSPPPEPTSVLASHIKGAPQAASIFNHAPMDLETIPSANNSFAMSSTQDIFSGMDKHRPQFTNHLGRVGSGQNLMRSGSGRNLMGTQNAGWGADAASMQPSSSGGYARSGIIRKNASEGALNHSLFKGGMKRSGASRENLMYMKRTSSGRNMIGSSENLQSMLPVRRMNHNAKHSLGRNTRSQPVLGLTSSRPSPKYQQNAKW